MNSANNYGQGTWKGLLARMNYSEAGDQSGEGRRGCAYLAQSRPDRQSDEFGLTMKEVKSIITVLTPK